jgi:rhodanese-related sulfurtransferase
MGIAVNEFLQTSDPDIYAVGDAIEFKNPVSGKSMISYLAGPANKQGRICANNMVLGNTHSYHGSINTAIVQVFDITVATAGMASKHLKAANINHIVSTNHAGSHAAYFPGSSRMAIQIVFSPDTGRLLGAQIAGYEGVDKRIDIMSSYIQQGGSIHDLAEFEHAYAPPYSSAKDPVNMAGFVAENILADRLKVFYWDELAGLMPESLLMDVRNPDEFSAGFIPGAINIPLDDIRERLQEIPAHKKILIYCEAGLRGYLAQRILKQHGFDLVSNLSGGYVSWKACVAESEK